jgi:hypothetical protein
VTLATQRHPFTPLLDGLRRNPYVPHGVVFLASSAAFLEQPLVGKALLPLAGGGAGAWVSTLVFFQAALVLGYLVGNRLARTPGRASALLLAAIAAGPLVVVGQWTSTGGLLAGLVLIAPGYIALTSTLILMSSRYARVFPERNAYTLAASSNVGSFTGLALGLAFTEFVSLTAARYMWWGMLIAAVTLIALLMFPLPRPSDGATSSPTASASLRALFTAREGLEWMGLAALGSGLLIAFTGWLNESTIVMPLLWVLPLSIYLLIFSLAFSGITRRPRMQKVGRLIPFVLLSVCAVVLFGVQDISTTMFVIGLGLGLFCISTWFVIKSLECSKPSSEGLPRFWVAVSIGGAAGGLLAGVVFPAILPAAWEFYPILLAPLLLISTSARSKGAQFTAFAAGGTLAAVFLYAAFSAEGDAIGGGIVGVRLALLVIAVACVAMLRVVSLRAAAVAFALLSIAPILSSVNHGDYVAQGRNLYGTWTVRDDAQAEQRQLAHGGIIHGAQSNRPGLENQPISYYGRDTGVAEAFRMLSEQPGLIQRPWNQSSLALVGLGSGVLAGWGVQGQKWTFFEIDPDMAEIAQNQFTYLSQSEVEDFIIIIGDARLNMREVPPRSQEVIVLDAYLGDSVPTHLLTREAYELFESRLTSDGVILTHISNQYLDLIRVVFASARENGLTTLLKDNEAREATVTDPGVYGSLWAMSTRNPKVIDAALAEGWEVVDETTVSPVLWTDDLTPFLRILS